MERLAKEMCFNRDIKARFWKNWDQLYQNYEKIVSQMSNAPNL